MGRYSLKELNLQDRYATNRNDLVAEFYRPCLERAVSYDRAVGYFHSSIFLLTARPVADFAMRKGKIRLICSPELTKEDIVAISDGYEWRERINEVVLRTINQNLENSDERPMVEFIATLIALGCMDIRIAFRPNAWGIFHDKVGIIGDEDGNRISFTGSSNETFRAWDTYGNHESFDVFCSWTSDARRVAQHTKYFESLWDGLEPGVETMPFPEVAHNRLVEVASQEGINAAFNKAISLQGKKRKTPQAHQLAAIEAWKLRGNRGILQHATGSGKTFTAITIMRDWLEIDHPVLVLVPSELLLIQWYREIQSELEDLNPKVLLAGGGYTEWHKRDILEGFTDPGGGARIILATLQTASTSKFLNRISSEELMVVIDEVHRAGSPRFSKVLSIQAGPRLGLSATPYRYGDPVGTNAILEYFNGIVEPPFTLADAIAAKRLCQYTYHIHPAALNEQEINEWQRLSRVIKQKLAKSRSQKEDNKVWPENIKRLLIKRADIIKNAEVKISLALDVLKNHYIEDQSWLVYCDDQSQMQKVIAALKGAGFPCDGYHSAMSGSQEATLDHFSMKGGIIVAIRCLDEGIDIPTTNYALILASSRNPREFIQRRGRVLRITKGKFYAHIHDTLVIPPLSNNELDDTSILRGELTRAIEFADSAVNDDVKFELRQLARKAGIELDNLTRAFDFENDEDLEE